jgi:hypothetical protein
MTAPAVELTVLLPLFDPRGDPVDRLRAWTKGQTCPRERYQIALATPGDDPEVDARLQAELGPRDRLVHADARTSAGLYEGALAVASAPWVLLTEMHVVPHPDCIEALLDFVGERPEVAGAALAAGHRGATRMARLEQLRYRTFVENWDRSDHWYKVRLRGTLLRADVVRKLGGFFPDVGGFIDQDLSARLHAAGHAIGSAPRARIDHDDAKPRGAQAVDVAGFVLGELHSRERNDPDFCERYFGPRAEWDERGFAEPEVARQARRGAATTLARTALRPHRWRWLPSLASESLRRGLGMRRRATAARLASRAHEWLALGGFGDAFLTRHYEAAATHLAHALRLDWVDDRVRRRGLGAIPSGATLEVAHAWADRIVGFHGRESREGASFRWSGPTALIRVRAPAADARVTVSLEPLRPRLATLPIGIFWNGHAVAAPEVADDAIRFDVPAAWSRAGGGRAPEQRLLIVCPKLPRSGSRAEPRRLGLAVRALRVEPRRASEAPA